MGDVGSKTTCHFSPFNLATCSGGERTARRKGGRSALTKLICLAAWLIHGLRNGGRCILCRLALPHRGRSGNPFDLLGDADGPSLGRGTAKSVRRCESTKVPERAGRRFADTVRMSDRGRCRREAGQAYALSLTVGRPRERPLPSCRRRRGQTPDRNGAWTERGIGNPPSHGTVFYHRTAEKTRRLPACVRTHASLGRGAGPPEVISGSDIANFIFARSWDDGLRQDYGTTDYETTDHETTDYGDTGNRGNGDEPTTDV